MILHLGTLSPKSLPMKTLSAKKSVGLDDLRNTNVYNVILSNSKFTVDEKLKLLKIFLFDKGYIACDAYIPLLISPLIDQLLKMPARA